jgi:hypothetical protein
MRILRQLRGALPVLLLLASSQAAADVPATEVMTVYRFNGALEIPYYGVEAFQRNGTAVPAGAVTQGTSLVPCLVIRNGRPLTDGSGTPLVGFEVVVDSRRATRESAEQFKAAVAARRSMSVTNHHCADDVAYVLDARNLFALDKPPRFDPPAPDEPAAEPADQPATELVTERAVEPAGPEATSESDQIVRAFHNSALCADANRELVGRRAALQQGWSRFSAENVARWSSEALIRARQLDFAMRTAIFEGHLDRGCNAYGSCERNIIALSIRNRARESCRSGQGCGFVGDVEGVASNVSQYNIWDEYLTQVSGLTSCYLRRDLVANDGKLGAIYAHTVSDVERILFGDDNDLEAIFPRQSPGNLKALRHYYHPPAMGKCFPDDPQVEFMAGAVAGNGENFVLLANTRIEVGDKVEGGFLFRDVVVSDEGGRDVLQVLDHYRGFVVDGRKVTQRGAAGCLPYGIPRGCKFDSVGRYRKTPGWLRMGDALEIHCRVPDRGEQCQKPATGPDVVSVGGTCDTEMRPVSGVP